MREPYSTLVATVHAQVAFEHPQICRQRYVSVIPNVRER